MKTVLKVWIFTILLLSMNSKADPCQSESKSSEVYLKNIADSISTASKISLECAEQEVVDVILDPYRVQSFALKKCDASVECKKFLISEAARISKKSENDFIGQPLVYVWGEMLKFSGHFQTAAPLLTDLPLTDDPEELFSKLKKEKLATRELNKSENTKFACAALAMIIGPGKLKALNAGAALTKTYKIQHSHEVTKLLSKNRLPTSVKEKFAKWTNEVESKGLDEVKKISGYHDEPIISQAGRRSVRMSDGYRVCYEMIIENGLTLLKIITISQDHKNYCK